MTNKLNEMCGNWYGYQQDIFAELNEMGLDVHEANSEYITTAYTDEETDEDVVVMLRLGGTERTITIDRVEEIYRG